MIWNNSKDSDTNFAESSCGGSFTITGPHSTPGYYDMWWVLTCRTKNGSETTTQHSSPAKAVDVAEKAERARISARNAGRKF